MFGNFCWLFNYVFVIVVDGFVDGVEDIVCVKGMCLVNGIKLNIWGIFGYCVVVLSGSDEFIFEYLMNFVMIVGWDFDVDGQYLLFDFDDCVVIDGIGFMCGFLMNSGCLNDYFEIVYVEVRNYNYVILGEQIFGGFLKVNQGCDMSYFYVYDIEMCNMLVGKVMNFGVIVFDFFLFNGMEFFVVENVLFLNIGGYFG